MRNVFLICYSVIIYLEFYLFIVFISIVYVEYLKKVSLKVLVLYCCIKGKIQMSKITWVVQSNYDECSFLSIANLFFIRVLFRLIL